MKKPHKCDGIKNTEIIFIQTLKIDAGEKWFWHFANNPNTLKEKIECHEIIYCPYCGEKL